MSVILPSALYLGPCSSASSKSFLTANSITHVLSIGATPTTKVDSITYHRLSLNDSQSSSIATVSDAANDLIDSALKSNKDSGRILVHCAAGISRSPTIVVAYIMKRRQISLKAALGQVIRARPQVLPNAGFLQQLKAMEMELFGVSTLDVEELPRRDQDRLALFMDGEVDTTNQS